MPGSPPTLRDMVNEALDSGLKYRQLAERAIDPETGQTASLSLFHDIARGNVNRAPSVAHLRAIAAGLGKPFDAVRQAAIAEYLPGDSAAAETSAILAKVGQLTEEARLLREQLERRAGAEPGERETA